MTSSSRRGFLKAASVTAAGVTILNRIPAWANITAATSPVQVWGTFRDRRHASSEPLAWKPIAPGVSLASNAIVLDPTSTRQEMLGFGAAFTDAACYMLNQLSSDKRATLMNELFAPDQMALNVCRTCIGASDYSKSLYSFDDSEQNDPELNKFSIDHDKAYILPMLRQARKLNPDLFLYSSPWSPPAWMKFNRSMLGGTIRKSNLEPYSRYFKKFLDAYKAEGIHINAVTVQNETDTTVDGRYAACQWSQEDEALFVGKYLGPLLRQAGIPTKIWVLDHNFTLWGRAIGELSDPLAYEFIDGVAWHGYAGEPSAMTQVHDAFPQKNAYFTEGGPQREPHVEGTPFPDPMTSWARWSEWANSVVRNWSRSITMWNLALDENGTPYIGHHEEGDIVPGEPRTGQGVITIDSKTHQITRSGRFWALAHYTRHVRRGAKVFRTDGVGDTAGGTSTSAVSHVGFRNPDGSYVVVLSNRGQEKRIELVLGSDTLAVELPADSVHTLQWS
ncbi:MAG: twin-arginine translocation signal domain-containing protein [Acidobacteriota bacterium]|nr:twin-arginine translocation signal domain-containing protein [Acidobacteriota bacterium]